MIPTSIYIRNENVGDRSSGPFAYFDELRGLPVAQIDEWETKTDVAVFGGGGLLGPAMMDFLYQSISLPRLNILWGVGTNVHNTKAPVWPSWLNKFAAVGLRDYENPYDYVPCASCMSPVFDSVPAPIFRMVVYQHYQFPIPLDHLPRLNNWGNTLSDVIKFMAAGEIVVTNSYHGVYWAQLLGRRVILWKPFSNRFHYFQYPPVICDSIEGLDHAIEKAEIAPSSFLKECRQRNITFKNKVLSLL